MVDYGFEGEKGSAQILACSPFPVGGVSIHKWQVC